MTQTTNTEPNGREHRIWQIRDIMSRVGPEDVIDAEMEAAIAILTLADVRLSVKPVMRIQLDTTGLDIPAMDGTGSA